jgi:hypothetical protein
MKGSNRKWLEWIVSRGWIDMDEEHSTDEEKYQNYVELHARFVNCRNVNEAESFDKVHLLNEELSKLRGRLKKYYSRKDAGTAGDIVEIEISKLLRKIVPSCFNVKTKGIIRDKEGNLSPQIDLLILDKDYPSELLSETTVSAESVLLAIECKLTLRKNELVKSIQTARYLKNINDKYTNHLATNQIKYGVFALSCEVRKSGENSDKAVMKIIEENSEPDKPLELIDFVCVPNDFCIYLDLYACDDPNLENPEFLYYIGQLESHALDYPYEYPNTDPLGRFIYKTVKLVNRLTNTFSHWNESNFGMFDTVSSNRSDLHYQRLSESEVNSVLSRQVNDQNSKIHLSFGRRYIERHNLN